MLWDFLRIHHATFHQACHFKLWKWEQTTKSIKTLSSTEPKVRKTLAIRLEVHHGMESSLGWCYGPRERGNSWETPVEFQLSVGNQDGWCGGKWACFPKIPGLKMSWEIIPIRWWLFLSQATCGFISLGTTPIWKENPSAHPVYSPANHTFVPLSILHITTSTTVL